MSAESNGFPVAFEFESVLSTISKQIYETPLAFLRENVQNAVDALRMQAAQQGINADAEQFFVRVSLEGRICEIVDNGNGMTREQLQNLFWTIGASGKRTPEARAAGCVGMFGIGDLQTLESATTSLSSRRPKIQPVGSRQVWDRQLSMPLPKERFRSSRSNRAVRLLLAGPS